ncbi:MAG: UDP-N-acetylmuramate dehydrogenase, partial [Bacteroidota bacterium]
MKITQDQNLLSFNTFGFKVSASEYFAVQTVGDLHELHKNRQLKKSNLGILGGGSNITFTANFDGLLLHNQIK